MSNVQKNEDMLALDVRNLINDVSAQLNLRQMPSWPMYYKTLSTEGKKVHNTN